MLGCEHSLNKVILQPEITYFSDLQPLLIASLGRGLLCSTVVFPEHEVWSAWSTADPAPFLLLIWSLMG